MAGYETPRGELIDPSRRDFLVIVGALAAFGAAGGGLASWLNKEDAKLQERNAERDHANGLGQQIAKGMEAGWKRVTVWPGLAILPAGLDVYSSPTFNPDTKLDRPKSAQEKHLLVQRPFMVRQSVKQNQKSVGIDSQQLGDEVFGFWLPDSQQVAFVDRRANENRIIMPSHSEEKIYADNYERIFGEPITLQPPRNVDGLTWRYLEIERKDDYYYDDEQAGPPPTIKKVCGRSVWATLAEAEYGFHQFYDRNAINLIPLPEAQNE